MAQTLLDLPLELLQHVTSFLDTPSYGNLRLTSTVMEKNTFEAFAKEFFSTKQFMIWSFSLQTLVDISRHPTLSRYIQKIVIGLESLYEGRSLPVAPLIEKGVENQSYLLQSGLWVDYLTEALLNFPNCHEIEVRDFESNTKKRDDGVWHGYGSTTWRKEGGSIHYHWLGPSSRHLGSPIPSIVFNQVIVAIAKSGMNCKYLGHVTKSDSNALQMVAFTVDDFHADSIHQALGRITSLTIAIGARYRTNTIANPMKRLLASMKSLTRLRLNGDMKMRDNSDNMDEEVGGLVDMFAIAPIARLELGKTAFTYKTLSRLCAALQGQSKIENMTLFRVRMDGGTWCDAIDTLAKLSSLKSLSINRITQSSGLNHQDEIYNVSFKSSSHSPADGPRDVKPDATARMTATRVVTSGGSTTTHVKSFANALADLKASLVVQDKPWQKKHKLILSSDSSDFEEDDDDSSDPITDEESEDEDEAA